MKRPLFDLLANIAVVDELASIQSHVEQILNTRVGSCWPRFGFANTDESLFKDVGRACKELKMFIGRYEPRLRRLTIIPGQSEGEFKLTATLVNSDKTTSAMLVVDRDNNVRLRFKDDIEQ